MTNAAKQQAQTTTEYAGADLPTAIEEILRETKHGLSPRNQYDLLRTQIAPGCTDEELALFMYVAKARGLDPFLRQIYALKREQWDPQQRARVSKMTIQTGIDGFRLIAARTKEHDGTDAVKWTTDADAVDDTLNPAGLVCASVTVYRRGKPYPGEAWWEEYAQVIGKEGEKRLGPMWLKMPRGQLEKCAEAKALRRAFPEELGSLYVAEEMNQADTAGSDADVRRVQATIQQATSRGAQIAGAPPARATDFEALLTAIRAVSSRAELLAVAERVRALKDDATVTDAQRALAGVEYRTQKDRYPDPKPAKSSKAKPADPSPAEPVQAALPVDAPEVEAEPVDEGRQPGDD
jgi:phage recombination protein Bet